MRLDINIIERPTEIAQLARSPLIFHQKIISRAAYPQYDRDAELLANALDVGGDSESD